jgi:hypothetical protein
VSTYYGVSAPLGSGKTTAALDYSGRQGLAGQKVVIAQPSINLIKQSVEQFRERWPKVPARPIHSECGTAGNVAKALADHTKEASNGEVLFITHSALMQCQYWDRRSEWHLIMDEAPQVFFSSEITLPKNYNILLPALNIAPANIRYSHLTPGDARLLEEIAVNRDHDQVYSLFQDFAAKLLSQNWGMYVLSEQWERFQGGQLTDGKLLVFGLIEPSVFDGFASTTIMSANLEQTLIHRHLIEKGYGFQGHERIAGKLRYTKHGNGDLLTIHYAVEDGNWSKRRRDVLVRVGDEECSVNELIICGTQVLFGEESFVWLANKDIESRDPFDGRGIKLPHSPHGLNDFQHIHNAAILPALNPSPALYAFLDEVAHFDPDEVRQAVYFEAVYQAAGRISLRNPEDLAPKHVVVADLAAAENLKALFPGANLMRLPLADRISPNKKVGRTRKYATDAARKAEYRNRHKAKLLDQLDQVNLDWGETKSPISLKVVSSRPESQFGGSIFNTIHSKEALDQAAAISSRDFVEYLHDLHHRAVSKEAASLWCPAEFDPGKSNQTSRGLANITAIWGLWLDNDGGDLGIDEFVAMFPHLEMVIYNSASSIPTSPRWRVVIPTTCAMTNDVHNEIIGQIKKSLGRRGYFDKKQLAKRREKLLGGEHHGFDASKFTPSSLFYLPAQALAGPEASFFFEFNGGNRQPINPYQWVDQTTINHQPEPEQPVHSVVAHANPSNLIRKDPRLTRALLAFEAKEQASHQQNCQARVDAAISTWHQHPKGTGNQAFFRLAASLAGAGMGRHEIEQTLHAQAAYAHGAQSQKDRRAAIPGIMRTLRCAA